mmetsp:Transcript_2861/g.6784  ORF Transcript_2861/g.6784 Transcript_2861/m.6784 type:complete len:101 (-) Transcript_2861:155-457(-)
MTSGCFGCRSGVHEMKSGQLREMAKAAVEHGAPLEAWDSLSVRCVERAEKMNYWDILAVLQAYAQTGLVVQNHDQWLFRMPERGARDEVRPAPRDGQGCR